MADILRVGKIRPGFLDAARIFMVESAGRMRVRQQATLRDVHPHLSWIDKLDRISPAPTLIIANEFFDCLPIRQFVRTAEDSETPWRERLVGRTDESGRPTLCFVHSEATYADRQGMPPHATPEQVFEECEAGTRLIEEIAGRLKDHKGRALIIDYGHGRSGFGDTFQAVKRHDHWHPLAAPGEADVTAHVDFAALARAGRDSEIRVDGPIRQGDFLARLGILPRLERLVAAADQETGRDLKIGAERLVAPNGMGTLFKVLALSSAGLDTPPGFE